MKKFLTLLTLAIALTGTSAYSATGGTAAYYLRFYTDFSSMPQRNRSCTLPLDILGFLHHPYKLHAQPLHHGDAEHAHMNIYNDKEHDRWSAELTTAGKTFITGLTAEQQKKLILNGIAFKGAGMRREVHLDWHTYRTDINCASNTFSSSGIRNKEGILLSSQVYYLFSDGKQPDFESFIEEDKSVFSMQVKAIVEAIYLHINTLTSSGAGGATLSGDDTTGTCGGGSAAPGSTA